MDIISKEARSKNMSKIKSKNTKPEIEVRKILHSMGYRFSLNKKTLPGKPDIWLKKYNTAIFVHGCFWHRHENCKLAYTPKTRTAFWTDKFNKTIMRDKMNVEKLKEMGISVLVIWECEIFNKSDPDHKNLKNILDSFLKKQIK
ncbi:T/G mismatch-specific endonuclease [Dethiosulfatibacter aminovorans DSM 17477]|uniref:Very short patch repair endonuclease n=1 Tax=Dethiosulfatibacter aminovorans DSM 17477 TaxID=1121476 RepID=A0A1M6I8Y8_9FIRM|nr:DNA mismatch endonuclease Vsr [Dethiosulfatibacter aminovorans]SHJ30798.1 T/G mismatch-specific endonuclease [Dethiosulfatibacter aminovorans DSM 17477]